VIRRILLLLVDRFERRWSYPSDYLRDLVAISPMAAVRFMAATALTAKPRAADRTLWHAAKVATGLHDGCGPCAQLALDMAAAAGLAAADLAALVAHDEGAMSEPARHGWLFAHAVLAGDAVALAVEREWVEGVCGRQGLADVALAVAGVRLYPVVRRALGHGEACSVPTLPKRRA
jgi:hypothetical protein